MDNPTLWTTQQARTAELHRLMAEDPTAWAICTGKQTLYTIAGRTLRQTDDVQADLDRLLADGAIKRTRRRGKLMYIPHSTTMVRLAKRAAVIKYKLGAEYRQSLG